MKKTFFLAFVILFLSSCNKTYKYIETVKEKSVIGNSYDKKEKEPEFISAKNDSLAYIKAYEKFCISLKVWKDMANEGLVFAKIPESFSLYDTDGKEVYPYVSAETLDNIKQRIMSLGNEVKDSLIGAEVVKKNLIDSLVIRKLSPLFIFKKDEFDPRGLTWVKPKSAPQYTNRNGIYCYFMQDIDGVSNFRFKIQYYADDWLFIRKYQFSIDGKAYEFIPNNVETDSGDGYIWEWCDKNISSNNDIDMIKALSEAKTAKIKFVGRQYHDIKTITQKEIKGIKDAINLYIAMGGSI